MPEAQAPAAEPTSQTPEPTTTPAPAAESPATTTPAPVDNNLDLSAQDPNNNGSAWLKDISEKFRTDPSISKYTSLDAALTGLVESQKVIRSRQEVAKMPDENSTDEQRQQWRKHIGAPDTISNYETPETIKGLDADHLNGLFGENGYNEVVSLFDELNITQHQANKLTDGYLHMIEKMGDSFEAEKVNAKNLANEKAQSDLKADWGENYEANLNVYSSIVEQLGVRQTLLDAGLNNNPAMIRMFTKIASSVGGEHSIEGTVKGGYGKSYDDRIKDLNVRKANDPTFSSTDYTAEWNKIHADAFGKG